MVASGPSTTFSLLRSIKSSGLYAAGEFAARAVAFAMLPVWTFYLEPEEFGVYEISRLLAVLLTCIGSLGLGATVIKYAVDLPLHRFRRFYSSLFFFQLVWVVAILLLMELVGPYLLSALGSRVTYAPYGRIATMTAALMSTTVMPLGLLVLREKPRTHVLMTALLAITTASASVYLVIGARKGPLGILAGDLIGASVLALACFVVGRRDVSISMNRHMLTDGLRYSIPLVFHLLAHQVLAISDRFVIDVYHGSADVGIYSVSYRFASVLLMANLALNRSQVPLVNRSCRAIKESVDHSRKSRHLRGLGDGMAFFAASVTFLGIGMMAVSPEFIRLAMDEAYVASTQLTTWVVLGVVMHGYYLVTANILLYHKRTGLLATVTVTVALLNIFLNVLFVPEYGPMAAALTTLFCYGTLAIVVAVFAMKHVRPSLRLSDTILIGVLLTVPLPALVFVDGLDVTFRLVSKFAILMLCGALMFRRLLAWRHREKEEHSSSTAN